MTEATAREIFAKLDKINAAVTAIDKRFDVFVEGTKPCREKCFKTHRAVFGNGFPGIQQRMWAIWGLLSLISVPVVYFFLPKMFALVCG